MGISETIIAAMIGALATVTTALFQLFNSLRNRSKVDVRPRRGSAMRSVLAILALMAASAAGGFLYSELIKQRNAEDMLAMRQELRELREWTEQIAQEKQAAREAEFASPALADAAAPVVPVMQSHPHSVRDSVESMVYMPACRRSSAGAACEEAEAQRIALCGAIPAFARVDQIELFVQPDAVQNAWEEHRARFEQDLGGARFTGKSFEYAQGPAQKAVCVNFMHWSSEHPHIARILVRYGFGDAPSAPDAELMPSPFDSNPAPAVIAAEGAASVAHSSSLMPASDQ